MAQGFYSKADAQKNQDAYSHKYMFTAALFTQPTSGDDPNVYRLMNGSVCTMEYYPAIKKSEVLIYTMT